jgi:hypothetical protein
LQEGITRFFLSLTKELGLHLPIQFDFNGFGQKLADNLELVSAVYYIGKVRAKGDDHSQRLRANQQRLMAWLKRCNWGIEFGHMLKDGGVFHEKGVDVHITKKPAVACARTGDFSTSIILKR